MNEMPKPKAFFFKIGMDDSDPEAFMAPQIDNKGFDKYRLSDAEWIDDLPDDVSFTFTQGKHPEHYMMGGAYWTLVSEAVRTVLVQHDIMGAQFLPVRVFHSTQPKVIGKYWALHVIQTAEALDWTHTIWSSTDIEEIRQKEYPELSIIVPALIWEHVKNLEIFRLRFRDKVTHTVYISANLKEKLEQANAISGFHFFRIKAY